VDKMGGTAKPLTSSATGHYGVCPLTMQLAIVHKSGNVYLLIIPVGNGRLLPSAHRDFF